MDIVQEFNGKRILIWGYGREGKSTEGFLATHCKPASVRVYEGPREGFSEEEYDLIVKSPGIVLEERNPKFTSQTELFLRQFRDQVVGVTGTKGKSTTASMLAHVLSECSHRETVLLGNIGYPCFEGYDAAKRGAIIVFELSCHQLNHLMVSPHIAIFLNLYEEHLDYYKTFERYAAAKMNITAYQKRGDYFLAGEDVPPVGTAAEKIFIPEEEEYDKELKILGEHNRYNAEFVRRAAVELFHCKEEQVERSLAGFTSLPHRLQPCGTYRGISFYDDSISTIPEATINAIYSISTVQTVIVGGMDRGISYSILNKFIRGNKQYHFICCYASGKKIYEAAVGCRNCTYVDDLEKAVILAKKLTPPGKACVLSPAAASYGYFKNFEERGDVFQELIKE